MRKQPVRRSDRISLRLPVRVSGAFAMGREFTTNTRTLLLSRHGAKILLDHELIPHSTLSVGCLETNKEADARLVGFMGQEPEGPSYGIEFLDKNVNLWNIEFPPLAESAKAVARLLLECPRCHAVELAYLNEIEALVFQVNHYLPRPCRNCNDLSLWKQSEGMVARAQTPFPVPPAPKPQPLAETPGRTREERKEIRFSLQFTACLRSLRWGEEMVLTERLSRGGFSFHSERDYAVDDLVEVAVPYNRDSGNIFVLGRIAHREGHTEPGLAHYGVSYVRPQER
ncbi:MAG: PilZ domain-containing protein [Acidobacteria bacterium]|nr:PilZ domain-containing protein [Acidobacteriota bacterium]